MKKGVIKVPKLNERIIGILNGGTEGFSIGGRSPGSDRKVVDSQFSFIMVSKRSNSIANGIGPPIFARS